MNVGGQYAAVSFCRVIPEDLVSENVLLLDSRKRWSDPVKIVSPLAFTPGPRLAGSRWPEWAEWLYRPIRRGRATRYFPGIAQRALSSRCSFEGKRLTSLGFPKVGSGGQLGNRILLGDESTIHCVRKDDRENGRQEIGIEE